MDAVYFRLQRYGNFIKFRIVLKGLSLKPFSHNPFTRATSPNDDIEIALIESSRVKYFNTPKMGMGDIPFSFVVLYPSGAHIVQDDGTGSGICRIYGYGQISGRDDSPFIKTMLGIQTATA